MFRWGFLIWILIVFLFKFVFTLNKGKDNIFCATTKQTGGTEWHGGHWLRKVSGNGKTTKFLEYGKCLETGKRQNPLNTESVQKQGNNKIPWIRKVSGNRKTTKSFESAKTSLTRGAERPFRCLDIFRCALDLSKTKVIFRCAWPSLSFWTISCQIWGPGMCVLSSGWN